MKQIRRALPLALGLLMTLSLAACGPKDTPAASSSPSASLTQEDVTPPDEILLAMAQAGLEEYSEVSDLVSLEEVLIRTKNQLSLVVVRQTGLPHAGGLENLITGLWDEQTDAPAGEVYTLRGDTGLHSYWHDQEGRTHLLLANTTTGHGFETGSDLAYFIFDGQTLTQLTELPKGFLYEGTPLPQGWEKVFLSGDRDFWTDLRAVPYPGGTELYTRNPDYSPNGPADDQPPQWLYLGYLALDGLPLAPK